jgi:hypothetical protein
MRSMPSGSMDSFSSVHEEIFIYFYIYIFIRIRSNHAGFTARQAYQYIFIIILEASDLIMNRKSSFAAALNVYEFYFLFILTLLSGDMFSIVNSSENSFCAAGTAV